MNWHKLEETFPPIGKPVIVEYADDRFRDGQTLALQEYLGFFSGEYKFRCSEHSYVWISDLSDIYWLEIPERKD